MSWQFSLQAQIGTLRLDLALASDLRPVALIGPNGSGKTSLLRLIAGAHRPDAGYLQVGDRRLFSSEEGLDLPPEARHVGYLPQGYGLFPHMSVLDNVAFGLSTGPGRLPRHQARARALETLRALHCDALATRSPQRLSGGESQRVALARALVTEPALLLLDEPLAALDASTRREVRAFLATQLRALALPTLLVTHDLRDIQALDALVCVLDQGKIAQRGTWRELRDAPANDFVADFVELVK